VTPDDRGNSPDSARSDRSVRERLVFGLCMAILGAWLGYIGYHDYRHTDSSERQRLLFQARTIEDLVVQQLEAIHTILGIVRSDLPPGWQENPGLVESASSHLKTLVAATPGLRTIGIFDTSIRIVASSHDALMGRSFPNPGSIAAMRATPDPDVLYVSPPFRTSLGAWTLLIARAVVDEQGGFAGLIAGSLDPESFSVSLQSVIYTPDAWAALVHEDGTLFVIEPGRKDRRGRNLSVPGSFFTLHRQQGEDATTFRGLSYATGEQRLVGMRTIKPAQLNMDHALYIAITRDPVAVYAEWRHDTLVHAGLYVMLCIAGSIALFLSQRKRRSVDRAETHLSEARATLESFFALAPDLLCIADLDGRFRKLNPSWEKVLGYPLNEMEGSQFFDYVHPEDVNATRIQMSELKAGRNVTGFVNRFRHQDGSYRYIEWQSTAREELIFAAARDVTERQRTEKRLEYLAYHDRLTGLPNRSLLFGRLSQSMSSAARNGRQVAVLYIDLDGFKEINDQFGHDQGDVVLQTVARRFLSAVRTSDTVARIGGDEFVVVLGDLSDPIEAGRIAVKMLAVLEPAISLAEGHECRVGASIGISVFPINGGEMNGLLEAADDAMYRSKQSGKNRYTYSDASPLTVSEEVGELVLDETLLVGVQVIDDQHRRMTEMVNRLNMLMRGDAPDDEVGPVLDELLEYTTYHFSTERQLMEHYAYPDLVAHLASHEYLLIELADFNDKIAQTGKLFRLKLTRDWLLQHIIKEDLPLGDFLQEKMAGGKEQAAAAPPSSS
jgi:diguanylate cyclase (GGDEF)-like protein/hemerythrin-like metal-binding protein/PAS domain S-box-containing protein